MSHPITLGDLLATLGAMVGLGLIAAGLLMIFAGGMSDAPEEGDATSSTGCLVLLGGAFLFLGSLGVFL